MICDFGISKLEVKAPNGEPSIAFNTINSIFHNSDAAYSMYLNTRLSWFKEQYGEWDNGNVHQKMLDKNGEPIPYFIKVNRAENLREQGRTVLYPGNQVKSGDDVILAYPPASNMIVSDKTTFNGKNEAYLHSDGRISVFNSESIVYPTGYQNNEKKDTLIRSFQKPISSLAVEVLANRISRILPNVKVVFTDSRFAPQGKKSFIRNGVIYIVQDNLDLDTPIHEVSHIYLDLAKHMSPEEFLQIEREAYEYLAMNPEYANKMKELYSDVTENDFIMEVLADLISMRSSNDYLNNMVKNGINPIGKESLWEKVKLIVTRMVELIKRGMTGIGAPLLEQQAITPSLTIRNMAKVLTNAFETGSVISKLSTNDLNRLNMAFSYDQRSYTGTIRNMNDITKTLFEEDARLSTMSIEEQLSKAMREIKVNVMGVKSIYINGEQLEFVNETDGEIALKIKEKLEDGSEASDNRMKDTLVEWINQGAIDSAFNDKMKKSMRTSAIFNNESVKAIKTSMDWREGMIATRASKLNKVLAENGIESNIEIPASIIGYDPIVTIDFIINKKGKKNAVLSIHDVTPDALLSRDRENVRGSIVQNIVGSVPQGEYYLGNKKGDARKLFVGILANYIMQDKNLSINNVMVTGFYANFNTKKSSAKPQWVDMVRLNSDIQKMGKIPAFFNAIEDKTLKDIYRGDKLKTNNPDYWLMLDSFWSSLNNDAIYDRNLTRNRADLTPREMIKLIKQQMNLKKQQNDRFAMSNSEYLLLFKALTQLEGLPLIDGKLNSTEQITSLRKNFAPAFGIKDDMLQKIRQKITQVGNMVVDKVADWIKVMDKITNTYNKYYNQGLAKHGIEKGSALFEKAFVTKSVYDENGNQHTVKLNRIMWTKDAKEDMDYANDARNLPDEILAANRQIVDKITETLIDVVYHNHVMNFGPKVKGGATYTREMAEKELYETTNYKKGMVPIMSKSVNELLFSTNPTEALKKFKDQHTNAEMLFQEQAEREQQERETLDELGYQFLEELHKEPAKKHGSSDALKRIGLKYDIKTGELILTDKVLNNGMSTNLDVITRYNVMGSQRKIAYESEVIPMVDGLRAWYVDMENSKGVPLNENLDYLNLFVEGTIFNRTRKMTGAFAGTNLEPTINMLSSMGGTIALAGNINVGLASGIWNNANILAEAIAQSISGKVDFGVSHIMQAYALFGTDFNKVTELAMRLHMVNMSENDIINHQYRVKTKQAFLSAHTAHWFNWATDMHARSILMVAQMLQEGTWDAYSLDDNGELVYDVTKDKRFYTDGKQSDEQKVLLEGIKEYMVSTGQMKSVNDKMTIGHDYQTMNKLKIMADKYVIGAYDDKTKARAGAHVIGRSFLMFKQFMTSRVDNLISEGMYIDDLGKWVVKKDADGKLMAAWERRFVEGQLSTVVNGVRLMRQYGMVQGWKEMNDTQKQNLARTAAKVALFLFMYLLFHGLVREKDDDDPNDMGVVDDKRVYRNVKFVYQEFFLLSPNVWAQSSVKPFAITNLVGRVFDEKMGGTVLDRAAKTFTPGLSTVKSGIELAQDIDPTDKF